MVKKVISNKSNISNNKFNPIKKNIKSNNN